MSLLWSTVWVYSLTWWGSHGDVYYHGEGVMEVRAQPIMVKESWRWWYSLLLWESIATVASGCCIHRQEAARDDAGAQLAFSICIQKPQLRLLLLPAGQVYSPRWTFPGNALINPPRGMSLSWFQIQSSWQSRLTITHGKHGNVS